MTEKSQFDEIVWLDKDVVIPRRLDENQLSINVQLVKMLCEVGTIKQWWGYKRNPDTHYFPVYWEVEEIIVEFQYWHQKTYNVGDIDLAIPDDKTAIISAVKAVKTLEKLGMEHLSF